MPNKTAAPDRTIEWAKLLDQAITTPGNIGNVYNRFYSYSFLNCLFLLSQGVTEPVATYDRWKGLGRQVQRGAKAKAIVRPINVKREEPDGTEKRFLRFKVVNCLFEVSQTAGEELPPVDIPDWNLDRALTALDIKRVPFRQLDGNMQGYSQNRNIAINPVAAYPLKTTMHEIGHVVLGHTTEDFADEYTKHRGTAEFQAEATAFLTMKELDQLTEDQADVSRAYIQNWLADERPGDSAIRPVFSAVNTMLKAGRPIEEAALDIGA